MSTNRKKRPTPAARPASAISDKVKVTVSLTADSAQQVEALAKELGVSKSELFERLTKEHLNQATPGKETVVTVNVESSAPATDDTALKQEIEAQANTIQELKQQLVRVSELEAQLAETVAAQTYKDLKKEAEQQKQTIADLQKQLEQKVTQTVDQKTYQALQEASKEYQSTIAQLQTQLNRIPELEQQLTTTIPAETYQTLQHELEQERNTKAQLSQHIEALEKELNESNSSLSQLQMKQDKISELEAKLAHSISEDNYHNLEYICAAQKTQMATLEQNLASLISTKTEHQGTASTTTNYDALKNYLQEQDDLINLLQKQVLELQGLASFGESQLSKWRNRTFNG
jgi:chromosome segregation ATPase